jgi:hypothetical protein
MSDLDTLAVLVGSGLSPAEAVDYLATVNGDYSQTAWGALRGRSQQAVSSNVSKARAKLAELPDIGE